MGETSVVYAWRQNEVIKLYNKNVPHHYIQYEAQAAEAAREAGVPTPRVTGISEYEDRTGIVFERVDGPSLAVALLRRPWLVTKGIVRQFAEAHAAIHEREVLDLREQRVFMKRLMHNAANVDLATKETQLSTLGELTDQHCNRLCHNDFHLGNVIVGKRGLSVVDWARAARGDPIVDVVTTIFKLGRSVRLSERQPVRRWFTSSMGRWFGTAYRRHYLARRSLSQDKMERLFPVITTAYRRDHQLDKSQVREEIRNAYQANGLDGLNEWAARAIETGFANEEHVNKSAYFYLRKRLPAHAIKFGERALEINPEDHGLAARLDELRAKS